MVVKNKAGIEKVVKIDPKKTNDNMKMIRDIFIRKDPEDMFFEIKHKHSN